MRWFGLSFAPFSKFFERFARQYRYSTEVSPDVALLKLCSPSVGSCKKKDTAHKHTYAQRYIHTHLHYTHIETHVDTYTHEHINMHDIINHQ